MARTLDVIGERWTLLILRELMLGPKRFTDLLPGLEGIGKNLLALRLKQLRAAGLVGRHELPPPAASRVYELTADGRALGPAMAELGRWGIERLDSPPPEFQFRPGWAMFPLAYMADAEAAQGLEETYEFRIAEEQFHLEVRDGTVEPHTGPANHPDLIVTMDPATLSELFFGDLGAPDALAEGRIGIEGAPEALQHALAILDVDPQAAT